MAPPREPQLSPRDRKILPREALPRMISPFGSKAKSFMAAKLQGMDAKKMAGAEAPARGIELPLVNKLHPQLDAPRALRPGDLSKRRTAGVKRTVRGPARERPDRMVERVQSLEPELQPLGFCKQEILVQAQIHVGILGAGHIAHRTGSERVRGRVRNVARVNPLDVRRASRALGGANPRIRDLDRSVAVWPFRKRGGTNSVGIGRIRRAPASERVQRQ